MLNIIILEISEMKSKKKNNYNVIANIMEMY